MSQKEFTSPPLPKSAPVQSELTKSANQKRIPQNLYQTPSKEFASGASGTTTPGSSLTSKHKQLPELQTNSKFSQISNLKNTPIGDAYRHSKSASLDGIGLAGGNDKKRLVDQFYDQFGRSPGSSTSLGNNRVNTPLLTRNNTYLSLANESRTNLVLNKFEFVPHDEKGSRTSEINDAICRLEKIIVKRVKEQVEINEDEFLERVEDFQSIQEHMSSIKSRVQDIMKQIQMEKINNFSSKYEVFEKEIQRFMNFLKILDNYESKLTNSRDRMNDYKRKLLGIRKQIDLGEQMKVLQHKKTENRNKWILFGLLLSLVVIMYMKLRR